MQPFGLIHLKLVMAPKKPLALNVFIASHIAITTFIILHIAWFPNFMQP